MIIGVIRDPICLGGVTLPRILIKEDCIIQVIRIEELLVGDILSVKLSGQLALKTEHHALRGTEYYLAHGPKGPLYQQAQP